MLEIFGWGITQQDLLTGSVTGLVYAALAAGFVLVYRSTGVLNLAHAELGAFAAALFVIQTSLYGINWWVAFVLSVFATALIGGIIELGIIRRLFEAPRLVLLIATIGIEQLIVVAKINLPVVTTSGGIPLPFEFIWEPTNHLRILPREVLIIIVVPILILGLSWFMTRTRFGTAVRASASNPDTARTFGISVRWTSTTVWVIAGALAGATGILFAVLQGVSAARTGTAALAAPLLLRVLVVSLLARMRSLPLTLVAGLGVGIAEKIVRGNVGSGNGNIVDLYLFGVVLVGVLFAVKRKKEEASWSLSPRIKAIPSKLANSVLVKRLPILGFAALFGLLALVPVISDSSATLFLWTRVVIFALIAMSVTIITGWSGQLSLAQFAFVGLGGLTMAAVFQGNDIPIPFNLFEWSLSLPWLVSLIVGTVAGVVAAFIIGLPSLRVKGLFLAVATLAFAVAASNWLFLQNFFTNDRTIVRPPRRPSIGPFDFSESRASYYYLCLILLGVVVLIVARLRRSGIGRAMIAVRENEDATEAATVSTRRVKLTAFALAGGIAAFGGGLYATLQPTSLSPATAYLPNESFDIVAITIIGGLGSIAGPILGTLWVEGIPALFGANPTDQVRLLTSSLGLLILLMYVPGGLLQIMYWIRDSFLSFWQRFAKEPPPAPAVPSIAKPVPVRAEGHIHVPENLNIWLKTENVSVHFGGNLAVDSVDFEVHESEVVGLIGTNGAGKSTLMNAIGGYIPSTGRIEVLGRDVSHLPAYRRHGLGLGRGFQAARLYPDLTVRETLMVTLEAREKSYLLPSMTGLPPSPASERRKRSESLELVDYLGLGRYADQFVGNLSTGTRRIVELAGLLAVEAKVLLLDEPTGGVAQREAEAFGPLMKRVQKELGAAMVVIEHDMPLVMSISDRVYCLEAGAVIAEGSPDEVRNDSLVIATYLGTNTQAIERSDAGSTPGVNSS